MCLDDVLLGYGWYPKGIWRVSGGCIVCVRKAVKNMVKSGRVFIFEFIFNFEVVFIFEVVFNFEVVSIIILLHQNLR